MKCRVGCGACCVALSISSFIPGMPFGKPAGVPCLHFEGGLCALFGKSDRPQVCSNFPAIIDICGSDREEAIRLIRKMEKATAPS